ncbi:hypothetical protein [Anaerocolumna jejuensis]|uniref:hypothetical protein n=1 Tax=Anaerocolumna jejuensis TaxID=259063 RepID=UPI003F7C3067
MHRMNSKKQLTKQEVKELIKLYDKYITLSESDRLMVIREAEVLLMKEKDNKNQTL